MEALALISCKALASMGSGFLSSAAGDSKQKIMATSKKPKILVVDDEPDVVELIEFNLKGAGWDVITAADGEELSP